MAENKYAKKTEELPEEKEEIKPVTTNVTFKKKSVGSKFKEFIFSGDAKEVKKDLIENTIKPAIIDGIYDVITGFIGGMLYDDPGRRRRRKGASSYEKSSYTNYYKSEKKIDKVSSSSSQGQKRLDLDNIEFLDDDKTQRENWEDAQKVKYGMINRINRYTDGATVQDLYDFIGQTCPDWMGVDYGWDDADTFEQECVIRKVRGGAIMSVSPPKFLRD